MSGSSGLRWVGVWLAVGVVGAGSAWGQGTPPPHSLADQYLHRTPDEWATQMSVFFPEFGDAELAEWKEKVQTEADEDATDRIFKDVDLDAITQGEIAKARQAEFDRAVASGEMDSVVDDLQSNREALQREADARRAEYDPGYGARDDYGRWVMPEPPAKDATATAGESMFKISGRAAAAVREQIGSGIGAPMGGATGETGTGASACWLGSAPPEVDSVVEDLWQSQEARSREANESRETRDGSPYRKTIFDKLTAEEQEAVNKVGTDEMLQQEALDSYRMAEGLRRYQEAQKAKQDAAEAKLKAEQKERDAAVAAGEADSVVDDIFDPEARLRLAPFNEALKEDVEGPGQSTVARPGEWGFLDDQRKAAKERDAAVARGEIDSIVDDLQESRELQRKESDARRKEYGPGYGARDDFGNWVMPVFDSGPGACEYSGATITGSGALGDAMDYAYLIAGIQPDIGVGPGGASRQDCPQEVPGWYELGLVRSVCDPNNIPKATYATCPGQVMGARDCGPYILNGTARYNNISFHCYSEGFGHYR